MIHEHRKLSIEKITEIISYQIGLPQSAIIEAIARILKKTDERIKRAQKKDPISGEAVLEMMILQFMISSLEDFLEDVDIEEIKSNRNAAGLQERKFSN